MIVCIGAFLHSSLDFPTISQVRYILGEKVLTLRIDHIGPPFNLSLGNLGVQLFVPFGDRLF